MEPLRIAGERVVTVRIETFATHVSRAEIKGTTREYPH